MAATHSRSRRLCRTTWGRAAAAHLAGVLLLPGAATAQTNDLPPGLQGIGIDQKLGDPLPLDLVFRDEQGRTVRLADAFDGRKPVLLTLVYYNCPMLCTLVLNDLVRSLRPLNLNMGEDFDVLTISFDPAEGPELAAAKQQHYAEAYGRPGAAEGWRFWTGGEDAIRRLTDAVGFRYRYDAASKQYLHPSGITILTPDGHIARYFFGVSYAPKDVRLALVEAARGRIGSIADSVLLLCFQYDASTGRYSLAVMRAVRGGAMLTVIGLGVLVAHLLRRERRRSAAEVEAQWLEEPAGGRRRDLP